MIAGFLLTLASSTVPRGAAADLYLNSSEPGCDGSNPDYVLCDDFEDGDWYGKDCDQANVSGGLLQTDGWCGTIYSNPISPAGAATCGARGAVGTNCTASSGTLTTSSQGKNMADHDLGPNKSSYDEVYIRYYIKPLAGYNYGAEKMLTINSTGAGTGGISIAGLGSAEQDGNLIICPVYDCNTTGEVYYYRPNVAPALKLESITGRWAFVEIRIKMNTPGQRNGVYQLWMDDCGTDGLQCTGTPTLRASHFTVQYQSPSSNNKIRSIWLENWANPGSSGTQYYDQLIVSKRGPIGFMNSGSTPVVRPAPPVLLP